MNESYQSLSSWRPRERKTTAATREFGEGSEVRACICMRWESERRNRGAPLVASQHYFTKCRYWLNYQCSLLLWGAAASYKSIPKVTLLKAWKTTLTFLHLGALFSASFSGFPVFGVREKTQRHGLHARNQRCDTYNEASLSNASQESHRIKSPTTWFIVFDQSVFKPYTQSLSLLLYINVWYESFAIWTWSHHSSFLISKDNLTVTWIRTLMHSYLLFLVHAMKTCTSHFITF